MNDATYGSDSRWPEIIADAIEVNFDRLKSGQRADINFVDDMAQEDERLYNPKTVSSDTRLSAAWNFADSYFDAACEGFNDVDGISWDEATDLLNEIVRCLRSGEEMQHHWILRYAS
jgi:hypothetical protein